MAMCEHCNGSGMQTVSAPCRQCKGTGEVVLYHEDGSEDFTSCPLCDYGLIYIERTCPECHGAGEQ